MPDPISWYALGRDVNDPQTILEAVDEKILTHNLDPSAHGQSDEAIYMHRISTLLDHVNYSIYNIKIHPEFRPIKAFVDVGGAAEFTDLATAIAYVRELGGGRIFIYRGTYVLEDDLYLDSNIFLEGEDDSLVFIDCNINKKIYCTGTSNNHKKNIEFKNITFNNFYDWSERWFNFEYTDDVKVTNCGFTFYEEYYDNNDTRTFYLYGCTNFLFEDNAVYYAEDLVYAENCLDIQVVNNFFSWLGYYAVTVVNCEAIDVSHNQATYVFGGLVEVASSSRNVNIADNNLYDICGGIMAAANSHDIIIENNNGPDMEITSYAIFMTNCYDVVINGNIIQYPYSYGIYSYNGSNIRVLNNYFGYTGSTAIYFNGTSTTTILIAGNTIIGADTGSIITKGNEINIEDNIILASAGNACGVQCTNGQKILITGNTIKQAGHDGLYIENTDNVVITSNIIMSCNWYGLSIVNNTCNHTLVVANIIRSNTNGQINDFGLNTLKDHNMTA